MYSNGGRKTRVKKVCLWSKMFLYHMVSQVKWLYHLNTRHPHCTVFRWIHYSDSYCMIFTKLFMNRSSKLLKLFTRFSTCLDIQYFQILEFLKRQPMIFVKKVTKNSIIFLLRKKSKGSFKRRYLQWGLEYRTFEFWIHSKTEHFKIRFSNCSVFECSEP